MEERVHKINQVVREYFEQHSNLKIIPAKDLMPEFIEAGIYKKDNRNGLPIRKDLRELDASNSLGRIPYAYAERKKVNTFWYFVSEPVTKETPPVNKDPLHTQEKATRNFNQSIGKRKDSDETYILDLCDQVLGLQGSRQHRFDFLRGDLSPKTNLRAKLPCDIYYSELDLVIEYNERQHTESVKHFDKPDQKTISGVHRGKQRKRYDERRRQVLPEHGIKVIDFHYDEFDHTRKGKLLRNRVKDSQFVEMRLEKFRIRDSK